MKRNLSRSVRALMVAGALLGAVGSASAADDAAARYAVVAMIGDELSIVTYLPTVGSNLDTNDIRHVANEDDRFDRLAVQLASSAIRRTIPGATVVSMKAADHGPYETSTDLQHADGRLQALIEPVEAKLRDSGTNYLVVISKFRGDAHLRTRNGSIGSGKLEGLGFYVDYRMRTTSGRTGASGRGFVAPYAYLTVSLVDVRTGAIVRSEVFGEGVMMSIAASETADTPWDVLTADQKVRALNGLIRRAIETAVPRVVAPI